MTCFRMKNGQTVRQWCKDNGLNYSAVYGRLDKGMPLEKAIDYKPGRIHITRYYKGVALVFLCGGLKTKTYRRINNRIYAGTPLTQAVEKDKDFTKIKIRLAEAKERTEIGKDTAWVYESSVRGICGTNRPIVENETGYGNFAEPSKRVSIRSEDVLLRALEKCEALKAEVEYLQEQLLEVKENRQC